MDYPWQQSSWQQVISLEAKQRLPHAILLSGSAGTGKVDFAQRLARYVLCQQPNVATFSSCGQCKSCRIMPVHPDFYQLQPDEGKQVINVDTVRALSDFVGMTPSIGQRRVALVHPAEGMNTFAANSLLKTLEEPPKGTLIILVTHHASRLMATIMSRCNHWVLPTPTLHEAKKWLQSQSTVHEAEKLLTLADGRPLHAQKLDKDEEAIALYSRFLADLTQAVTAQMSILEVIAAHKKSDLSLLLSWQLRWVMQMIRWTVMSGHTEAGQNHLYAPTEGEPLALLYKALPSFDAQWRLYDNLLQSNHWVDTPVNHDTAIEQFVLYWQRASRQRA